MKKVLGGLLFVWSCLFVVMGVQAAEVKGAKNQEIRGADISSLLEMEANGAGYWDQGKKQDALVILKKNGVNYVRLRIWNDPYDAQGNPYGAGTNDVKKTIILAQRAKKLGLKVLLDFHYSDFWVDPGKQNVPKAWKNLPTSAYPQELKRYTKAVLRQLKQAGAYPDMVQIGNEINNGMLWPYGSNGGTSPASFASLAKLLQAGVQAVRETQPRHIPIMLHVAEGGDQELFKWWFDGLSAYKVDYDVIGMSYYSYWHGTLDELSANMEQVTKRYHKPVIVVETAYGHTTANQDTKKNAFGEAEAAKGGYPATADGQAQFILDLRQRIQAVPNQQGAGFFYWEPLWYSGAVTWATPAGMSYLGQSSDGGSEWDNQAVFDFNGRALPALKSFRP